jgi:hypothetical protein
VRTVDARACSRVAPCCSCSHRPRACVAPRSP